MKRRYFCKKGGIPLPWWFLPTQQLCGRLKCEMPNNEGLGRMHSWTPVDITPYVIIKGSQDFGKNYAGNLKVSRDSPVCLQCCNLAKIIGTVLFGKTTRGWVRRQSCRVESPAVPRLHAYGQSLHHTYQTVSLTSFEGYYRPQGGRMQETFRKVTKCQTCHGPFHVLAHVSVPSSLKYLAPNDNCSI